RRQRVRHAGRRDLLLGHGLEERGLGLRRGAVDLVGEEDVGEDRSRDERELPPAVRRLAPDARPGDVGGPQAEGERDAGEAQRQRFCEGADDQRLAGSGHALDEHVTAGEESAENGVDDVVVPDDDARDLAPDGTEDFLEVTDRRGGDLGGHRGSPSPGGVWVEGRGAGGGRGGGGGGGGGRGGPGPPGRGGGGGGGGGLAGGGGRTGPGALPPAVPRAHAGGDSELEAVAAGDELVVGPAAGLAVERRVGV